MTKQGLTKQDLTKLSSPKITLAAFAIYLLALTGLILFKTRMSFRWLGLMFNFISEENPRSLNLIPFGGMLVLNGSPDYFEIVLNMLVFIPFGVFVSMLAKRKSFFRLVAPIFLTSVLYEGLQYIFALGASDITDVLANTLGGIMGVGLFFAFRRLLKERTYSWLNALAVLMVVVLGVILGLVRPLG